MTSHQTTSAGPGWSVRLAGLGAAVLLLLVVVGTPLLLIQFGQLGLPDQWPSLAEMQSALTRPDDGSLLLGALTLLGWGAWAWFSIAVLLELVAQVRGVHVPLVFGLRPAQAVAGKLVTAVLVAVPLLGGTAIAVAPANAADAAVSMSAHAVTGTAVTADTARSSVVHKVLSAPLRLAPAAAATEATVYEVQGRDTLWGIAERELGDGRRWAQIAELNYERVQPDGRVLDRTHTIFPGWQLQLPPDAAGAGAASPSRTSTGTPQLVVVEPGDTLSGIADEEYDDATLYPLIVEANDERVQPDGRILSDPDLIIPGWELEIPAVSSVPAEAAPTAPTAPAPVDEAPAEAAPAPIDPAPADEATGEHDLAAADSSFPVRTGAGVGALLAAGVIGLLAWRRTSQQRHRSPGRLLPLPSGEAAEVEHDLRSAADPLSVATVDLALRTLAARCAETGQPLPVVRAGRLVAHQFDLYLAEPATLPAPWTSLADASVWTLDADDEALVDAEVAAQVPAPYPSLVTVGHDAEDGHVFLNLEALGALAVTGGDTEQSRHVLAALAIELATSSWADDLQVTIVGAYPELEDGLQTGRIRYLPAVGHILDELLARAEHDREVLAEAGAADLNEARVGGTAPGVWTPEIVLLTGETTERQREKLRQLLDQLPRVAVAAVTNGDPVGEWAMRLTGTNEAVLEPIGLTLRPQVVDDRTYNQILNIMAIAHDNEDQGSSAEWASEPTLRDLPTRTSADLTDDETADIVKPTETASTGAGVAEPVLGRQPAHEDQPSLAAAVVVGAGDAEVRQLPAHPPRLLLLGPVELLHAAGPVEPSKRKRFIEIAAFLALNPGCDHHAIDAAIWPGTRITDNARNTAMSKLRRWVSANYFPRYQADAGYRLAEEFETDWHAWQQLLPGTAEHASTEELEAAVALVRGRPLDAVPARRYAWAEAIKQEMICAIVDASYELARRHLLEARWRAAESAIVLGLMVEPGMERLWRARILAAHASGNAAAVRESVDRLLAITDELGGDLEQETEELLEQLKDAPPRQLVAAL